MDFFVDKNILMDFVRLVYFKENFDWYKNQAAIILLAKNNEFGAYVSDVTPFSVGNYLTYKLERKGVLDADVKVRNALRYLFDGKWTTVTLDVGAFLSCLGEKRVHYEDAYQLACAKKSTKNIITRNVKDFQQFKKELTVLSPKEFMDKYFKSLVGKCFDELAALQKRV